MLIPTAATPLTLEVRRSEQAAADIFVFELRHPEGSDLPEFTAGSHLTVRSPNGSLRKYSLCNDPAERDRYVIGVKRDLSKGTEGADSVHTLAELKTLLPQADFVALTCPLTRETENVIDAAAFAKMKPCAYLINAARGRCVEEGALIEALRKGSIAGAALDVTVDEPLPPASPVWDLSNVFITPHTAGETRRYEDNVLDTLLDNLQRLWRGEAMLRNQIV